MQTNELVKELIDKINAYSSLDTQVKAVEAYNAKPETLPISEIFITFCTSENEVSFFEDENEECCKRTNVEIKADFIASPVTSTEEIYASAETLMDYLILQYAGRMKEYNIGTITTDNDLKALRLPCRLSFVYEQCPAYSVDGVAIKPYADFLCKTHVKDTTIHVSQEEKEYLNEPFVSGMYVGDGASETNIYLGFRPQFVLVFGSGTAGLGFMEDRIEAYFAFALRTRSTKGIAITSDGFKINYGESVVSRGSYPRLNDFAQSYNYIAFK